ncbi:zinc finger protein OZF-like isoform X4 [Armigeres subalbatus]|uniref:zinc finger protein OZF-like isoform X4 n=1 Tax=Armigeres subalbatus TaxID=124917 RepID=UPI002ED0D959
MMDICRLTSDGQPDSLKMVEIDFQALCRICGALGENLTAVYGKRAADRLRERIAKYLQIDILAEDCLPTKICDGCRETLDRFHELFEKCHRTDEKFRTMMSSSQELKELTIEEVEEQQEDEPSKTVTEDKAEAEEDTPPAKKSKETKRNSKQEEVVDDSPENKGYTARHSINIVSIDELPGECQEEIYGEYQFLEDNSEPDGTEPPSIVLRAQAVPLSKELIEQGKIISGGKIGYRCAECGKEMVSPYTYRAHLRIHSGERPFPCPHCEQTFRITQGLNRHVREVHEKVRNYSCEECGKCFGNSRNLKEHRFLHTNSKPYVCDVCGSAFNQKASLHMHKRTHETNRSFQCSVCGRSFYTRAKLELHETTHSDERAFACDECGLSFRSGHNLARHRKCHVSDTTFQCGICEAVFKQKRYLMRHLNKQHPQ